MEKNIQKLDSISKLLLAIYFFLAMGEPFSRNYLNDLNFPGYPQFEFDSLFRQFIIALLALVVISRFIFIFSKDKTATNVKKKGVNFWTAFVIILAITIFWQMILVSG